jgi:hypothetical protein
MDCFKSAFHGPQQIADAINVSEPTVEAASRWPDEKRWPRILLPISVRMVESLRVLLGAHPEHYTKV